MNNIIDLDYEREKRQMLADAKDAGVDLFNADATLIQKWREAMPTVDDEIDNGGS